MESSIHVRRLMVDCIENVKSDLEAATLNKLTVFIYHDPHDLGLEPTIDFFMGTDEENRDSTIMFSISKEEAIFLGHTLIAMAMATPNTPI